MVPTQYGENTMLFGWLYRLWQYELLNAFTRYTMKSLQIYHLLAGTSTRELSLISHSVGKGIFFSWLTLCKQVPSNKKAYGINMTAPSRKKGFPWLVAHVPSLRLSLWMCWERANNETWASLSEGAWGWDQETNSLLWGAATGRQIITPEKWAYVLKAAEWHGETVSSHELYYSISLLKCGKQSRDQKDGIHWTRKGKDRLILNSCSAMRFPFFFSHIDALIIRLQNEATICSLLFWPSHLAVPFQ